MITESASDWRRRRMCAAADGVPLSDGPVALPGDWIEIVNAPQSAAELAALRRSVQRSCPFGSEAWRERTAMLLGLQSSLRPQGRPRTSAAQVLRQPPVL